MSVPAPPVASSAPAEALPPSPERQFLENLSRAQQASESAGWALSRRIDVPGHHAALLVYDPTPEHAAAAMSQRFDAVGAGADEVPISGESGMIDAARTDHDSLLWDLRGDGARFVIVELTPCGANCQSPEPHVLALDAQDRFSEIKEAPECPTCISDADADGIPEFAAPIATMEVGGCPRVACGPRYALGIDVEGYESWDGSRFTFDLAVFKPIYAKKLADAREAAKALVAAPNKAASCPEDALRTAGELFAYGVLGGEKPADAIRESDRVMAGYTTAPCGPRYDMFDPPKPWSKLRAQLLGAKLPALDGARQKAAPAP